MNLIDLEEVETYRYSRQEIRKKLVYLTGRRYVTKQIVIELKIIIELLLEVDNLSFTHYREDFVNIIQDILNIPKISPYLKLELKNIAKMMIEQNLIL